MVKHFRKSFIYILLAVSCLNIMEDIVFKILPVRHYFVRCPEQHTQHFRRYHYPLSRPPASGPSPSIVEVPALYSLISVLLRLHGLHYRA